MKVLLFLAGLVAGCLAAESLMDEWTSYKIKFNKRYQNPREELDRLRLFSLAKAKVSEHNKLYDNGVVPYSLGINQWSDRTKEEMAEAFNGLLAPKMNFSTSPARAVDLTGVPDSIDWRTKGAVTPIKNQGGCGSCWAFSTTGALEGAHAIKHKKLVSLSEQQLLDCNYVKDETMGCSGGWPHHAYEYIIKNGGIDSEADYPYEGRDRLGCRIKPNFGASVKSYSLTHTEDELLEAVAKGPVSIAMNFDPIGMYDSGIFTDIKDKCTKDPTLLNHAVLVVGYGIDDKHNLPYWIVKNSWGSGWGEDGYFRIVRGKTLCMIGVYNVKPEAA